MKKLKFTFLLVLTGSGLCTYAQSLQDGINNLYAERYKNAIDIFQKMVSANSADVEANYWLGQAYLSNEEIMGSRIAAAKQLYTTALAATNNAPLIKVGMGHVNLLENKTNEARNNFESALTATMGKKGNDPLIEEAIGRAVAASKSGDSQRPIFDYAIKLLEDVTQKDPKNADAWVILGNLYRKVDPGSGGSKGFQAYQSALQANDKFALASLQLSKWATSIKDNDQVLQYLNEAVAKDAKFTAAYYDLFYNYFFRFKFPEAEDALNKYINSKLPEKDPQDQFLYAQLCWVKRDFACAIPKAESVVAATGDKTKPKVYRLLADAYYSFGDSLSKKGDSVTAMKEFSGAKKYSDLFFLKKNPEDAILNDYKLRAQILAKTGGTDEEIINCYVQGAQADSVLSSKIDFLKEAAGIFAAQKKYVQQAMFIQKIIDLKPTPVINDYFDLMRAYYNNDENTRSRDEAIMIRDKWPDQIFGYDWAFINSSIMDTVRLDSIAVPDAQSLFDFTAKDTLKYKNQYIKSVKFLAAYYINKARDKDKALDFFGKWLEADPANAVMIQGYIDQIKKMAKTPPPKTNPAGTKEKTKTTDTKIKTKTTATKPKPSADKTKSKSAGHQLAKSNK